MDVISFAFLEDVGSERQRLRSMLHMCQEMDGMCVWCVCVCVCARTRVRARACVRACVRAHVAMW